MNSLYPVRDMDLKKIAAQVATLSVPVPSVSSAEETLKSSTDESNLKQNFRKLIPLFTPIGTRMPPRKN